MLIIGLGAGVSSGIIGTYPEVDQVTVVELNDEVPGGTAQFKKWNFDVIHNPKVKIIINDGANYVKATRKKLRLHQLRPDPPLHRRQRHPLLRGPLEDLPGPAQRGWRDRPVDPACTNSRPTDWATIIHTFTSVFPNSSMWYSGIDVVLDRLQGRREGRPRSHGPRRCPTR